MNNFILNEKQFVEDFLMQRNDNYKTISSNYLTKLVIRYCIQYKKIESKPILKAEVMSIIKNSETNNKQDYVLSKFIDKVIDSELERKVKLREFDSIPLYESELEKINKCKKDREKKFLYTCYVLAEYYGNEWLNIPYKDLFKLSNITLSNEDRLKFIGNMYRDGYISISHSNTNMSLKVDIEKKGDVVLFVDNIRNLGNKLLAYLKKDYKTCMGIKNDGLTCDKLIKVTNNRMKYCKECALKMDNKNKKRLMKVKRN